MRINEGTIFIPKEILDSAKNFIVTSTDTMKRDMTSDEKHKMINVLIHQLYEMVDKPQIYDLKRDMSYEISKKEFVKPFNEKGFHLIKYIEIKLTTNTNLTMDILNEGDISKFISFNDQILEIQHNHTLKSNGKTINTLDFIINSYTVDIVQLLKAENYVVYDFNRMKDKLKILDDKILVKFEIINPIDDPMFQVYRRDLYIDPRINGTFNDSEKEIRIIFKNFLSMMHLISNSMNKVIMTLEHELVHAYQNLMSSGKVSERFYFNSRTNLSRLFSKVEFKSTDSDMTQDQIQYTMYFGMKQEIQAYAKEIATDVLNKIVDSNKILSVRYLIKYIETFKDLITNISKLEKLNDTYQVYYSLFGDNHRYYLYNENNGKTHKLTIKSEDVMRQLNKYIVDYFRVVLVELHDKLEMMEVGGEPTSTSRNWFKELR